MVTCPPAQKTQTAFVNEYMEQRSFSSLQITQWARMRVYTLRIERLSSRMAVTQKEKKNQ